MTEYVAGFLFDGSRVALVIKKRPKWQAGRMNGIGGHIEEGETPLQAMAREFYEETGYQDSQPRDWEEFAVLGGEDWKVHFFYAWGNHDLLKTTTDEEIVSVDVKDVSACNCIPNLTWLIPMAKNIIYDSAGYFLIEEKQ